MFAKFIHITAAAAIFLSMVGSNLAQEEASAKNTKTATEKEIQKTLERAPVGEKGDPLESDKSDSAKTDDNKPVVRRRIVDAKTLKKRRSKVGGFLMKPFRSIAPAVTARITQFEENKEYAILFGPTNLPVSPFFGSVSEGSGAGIGVAGTTKDSLSKDFRIFGSSAITTKHYIRNNVGFEITPEKFSKNKLKIKLVAEQLVQPEQHFFGSGIESSQSSETTFFHRQSGARLSVDFQINDKLKFGAFSEFTRNDITEGSDSDENTISESFNAVTLPGLERNVRLLNTGAYVQVEDLDKSENPRAGWFTKFVFSNVDSVGRGRFGWRNYKVDSRAYIPIGTKNRVVALRLLGDFKDTNGDASAVPFFRFARLGDSQTLRGYETFRFQGVNSLHLNLEYRFRLMQGFETSGFTGVEGVFFGDFGQVFNKREELKFRNIRSTWGGGLRFTTKESVALSMLYGRSPEGGRLILSFGKTF